LSELVEAPPAAELVVLSLDEPPVTSPPDEVATVDLPPLSPPLAEELLELELWPPPLELPPLAEELA